MNAGSLRLFNAILALVALGLLAASLNMFVDLGSRIAGGRGSGVHAVATSRGTDVEPRRVVLEPPAPSRAEFDVILLKDPFKNPAPPPAAAVPRPLPPPPRPTLLGTVMIGAERKAVIKDATRSLVHSLGDPVAGGTLVEIDADRIVIEHGASRVEVFLKTALRSGPARTPAVPVTGPAPAAAAGGAPPGPASGSEGVLTREQRLRNALKHFSEPPQSPGVTERERSR